MGTQAQNISTVAGNGTAGGGGDGGLATAAPLMYPEGVFKDNAGNLYIGEAGSYRIRKVAIDGTISTVAGNGTPGFSGDGGPATAAQLSTAISFAVDSAGNLFFADLNNHRVRKVATDGTISTVAGTGLAGFSGDGGPATAAQLNSPRALAMDNAGNLLIVDRDGRRVRKLATDGTISTVAGTGFSGFSGDSGPATAAQLSGPRGVAVDIAGNLYIADANNHRIRKVSADGTISTVAGTGVSGFSGDDGSATAAQLDFPYSVAVDSAGNLFISDFSNNRIRKITQATGVISTVAGSGTCGFSGDGGLATAAQLCDPFNVVVDPTGTLYIADARNGRIRRVSVLAAPLGNVQPVPMLSQGALLVLTLLLGLAGTRLRQRV